MSSLTPPSLSLSLTLTHSHSISKSTWRWHISIKFSVSSAHILIRREEKEKNHCQKNILERIVQTKIVERAFSPVPQRALHIENMHNRNSSHKTIVKLQRDTRDWESNKAKGSIEMWKSREIVNRDIKFVGNAYRQVWSVLERQPMEEE